MKSKTTKNRRSFMRRLGAWTGAVTGLLGGLVPEARAQAQAPATPAAPPSQSPPPRLQTSAENQLYSAALNDTDVGLLIQQLGGAMRIDPPTSSAFVQLDPTTSMSAVSLPIVSYSTQAVVAYVFYGTTSSSNGGVFASMGIKAMVSSAGAVLVAGGGRVGPSPKADWSNAFWAAMFPEQFVDAAVQAAQSGQRMRVSSGVWNRSFLRKVRNADNSKRGLCLRACARQAMICSIAATTAMSTGIWVGWWCISCMSLAIGVTVGTGGAAAPTIAACSTPCAIAQAAITAAIIALAICTAVLHSCVQDCLLIPPNETI